MKRLRRRSRRDADGLPKATLMEARNPIDEKPATGATRGGLSKWLHPEGIERCGGIVHRVIASAYGVIAEV